MNPQWHDEFVALCALFPSGYLTEEEWALLQVHLAYCESCRVIFEQYQQLASDVVPIMAANACSEFEADSEPLPLSVQAAEQRLMSRLDCLVPTESFPIRRKVLSRPFLGLIAACALGLASFVGVYWMHSKTPGTTLPMVVRSEGQFSRPPLQTSPRTDLRPQLETAQREVSTLRGQLDALQERYQQSSSTAKNIGEKLQEEQVERKQISDERDALGQQLNIARDETQSLRDKSAQAIKQTDQQASQTADLEAKIRDLNSSLDEKDRMLALDKEFLAHDREIRDLIGARDLYIADIQDVGQNGKTTKPFGRIFYTKDRSLVFYGYDLDKQAGLKQAVAFQAWGSGDDKQNVSLGLFYQDDSKKRWVLRFNDTKTLARLNMVFVTAEPRGGSPKPTGKPLLLAYLQVQANHP